MPHLSPLNWIIMPSFILMFIYIQMIFIYYFTPSTFPKLMLPLTKFSTWNWN